MREDFAERDAGNFFICQMLRGLRGYRVGRAIWSLTCVDGGLAYVGGYFPVTAFLLRRGAAKFNHCSPSDLMLWLSSRSGRLGDRFPAL